MIGPITVKLNAANPQLKLGKIYAYVNSPQTLHIVDTPSKIGLWNITDVYVEVVLPDNETSTTSAVHVGDKWVVTIPESTVSGTCVNGLIVYADAIDENGATVTGYILGIGTIVILDAAGTVDPEREAGTIVRFFDDVPEHPVKGDAAFVYDRIKIYNGESWL